MHRIYRDPPTHFRTHVLRMGTLRDGRTEQNRQPGIGMWRITDGSIV
ncbi:hypothetical protein NY08_4527 [Rhodococcus sp. B7740]|nr:hypothetical protein NY08_4527 [Rhodococcus sp. B7740]